MEDNAIISLAPRKTWRKSAASPSLLLLGEPMAFGRAEGEEREERWEQVRVD